MCWMGWNQSKKPFSKKMLEFISSINIIEDMRRISDVVKIRSVGFS